jgi:hypothetical protein
MFESMPTNSTEKEPEEESQQENQAASTQAENVENMQEDTESNLGPEAEKETAKTGLNMFKKARNLQEKIQTLIDKAEGTKVQALRNLERKTAFLRRVGMAALLAVTFPAEESAAQQLKQKVGPQLNDQQEHVRTAGEDERQSQDDESLSRYQRRLVDSFSQPMSETEKDMLNITQHLNQQFQEKSADESQQADGGLEVSPRLAGLGVSFSKTLSEDAAVDRFNLSMKMEGGVLQDGEFSPHVKSPHVEFKMNF